MNLKDQYNYLTPTNDQSVAIEKLNDFLNKSGQVFILKGYAGSGKTTLLKGIVKYLEQMLWDFKVMAPTGRAAKILREKTGHGATIHSTIYNLQDLECINKEKEDEAEHAMHYYFPIRKTDADTETILIIDESSLIGNNESKNPLFTFGSNKLLDDILTYANQGIRSKIIFCGDPAQLSPVGDSNSYALNSDYFEGMHIECDSTELREVMRQKDNLILENASQLRKLIANNKIRQDLKFKYDGDSFIQLPITEIAEKYTNTYPNPEIGDGVIISYSNQQCFYVNKSIREKLYPGEKDITPGEILLLNNNNYHTYGTELFNGDLLKVTSVNDKIITQAAPVINQSGKREVINLNFRNIKFRIPNYDKEISCFIVDSHLNSIDRDLSFDETRALYINFVIRFNENQKQRKKENLPTYKVGSKEFKDALRIDPFYNALKVKYGYAITCHKAQGGEWKKVIVDYSGNISLKTDPLKWCYTATTRASETLFAVNPPLFSSLSRLTFSKITNIGKVPKNVFDLTNIPVSPHHNNDNHPGKYLKYWSVLEKIENSDFNIEKIESRDYLERYYISKGDVKYTLDGTHDGSGYFKAPFKIVSDKGSIEDKEELVKIFNASNFEMIVINHKSEFEFLNILDSKIKAICNDLNISITNIEEFREKYYVCYYLQTSNVCSYIQFYFNDQENFSTALPKSMIGDNDRELKKIIERLEQNVV